MSLLIRCVIVVLLVPTALAAGLFYLTGCAAVAAIRRLCAVMAWVFTDEWSSR